MVYNTPQEIKRLLLLEVENQTLTDDEIKEYIQDANEEMVSLIRASQEEDDFVAKKEEETFHTFFNILEIKRIEMDGETLESSQYNLVDGNDGVFIEDLKVGSVIKIFYIPTNFKMLERAITMVNIIQRLSPFTGETINPAFMTWREKKKNFLRVIDEKFGVGLY